MVTMARSLRRVSVCLAIVVGVAGIAVTTVAAKRNGQAASTSAGSSGIRLPAGYRDWTVVSVAHEAGSFNDIRAILGNDVAIKAYRKGQLPFPDGTIVARVAWSYVPSEENDKVFGKAQSFVAGAPTNVQLMVKDSKKYAATGGWGYAQFTHGKADPIDAQKCYVCHEPVKDRDFIFTRYAP
jgi:Cytochrome P460